MCGFAPEYGRGVPLSVWYDWKDDGPNAAEREHNFGTVRPDLSPKPAYRAAQTLTRELAGYRIVRRVGAGGDKDFVLLLADGAGRRKLAAWTLGKPHAVSLDRLAPEGKATGITLGGEPFTPKVVGKKLVLHLGAAPKYMTLGSGPR